MKILNFTPLHLTIALVIGIITSQILEINRGLILFVLLVILGLLTVSYLIDKKSFRRGYWFARLSFLLFCILGFAITVFQTEGSKPNHYKHLNSRTSENDLLILTIKTALRSNTFYHRYTAELVQVSKHKTSGRVLLNVIKEHPNAAFKIGDQLVVKNKLSEIESPKNPYQFNYKKFMEHQGVFKQLFLKDHDFYVVGNFQNNFTGKIVTLRSTIKSAFTRAGFQGNELSIINALLLGQRNDISKQLIESYTRAGAIHILAISGLHVGLILLIITWILHPVEYLRGGRQLKLLLSVIVLWLYAYLTGLSPSVVRAVTMFSAVAIGLMGTRRISVYQSLIVSILLLLLIRPSYLFEIGFQLSYIAVFSIVTIQPILSKLWQPSWRITLYFWRLFTVSLAAQIGVLPLSLYYFHEFPGLFFLTNLVIIPVLGAILALGVLTAILSMLNAIPEILITGFEQLVRALNSFVTWVANQESFLFQNISFTSLQMLLSYFCIICIINWLFNKSNSRLVFMLVGIVLLQSAFIYEKWTASTTNEMLIFNKNRATLIGDKKGQKLEIYHTLDTLDRSNREIHAYITGANIRDLSIRKGLPTPALYAQNILLIDSLGLLPEHAPKKPIVLLIQSPKVNLERLIARYNPEQIIADHSNFKSFIKRWNQTCKRHEIPFHYTNQSGAWVSKN